MDLCRRLGSAALAGIAALAVVVAPSAAASTATARRQSDMAAATASTAKDSSDNRAATEVAALASPAARTACIASIAKASGPLAVVVGASFTAGVGATSPTRAWSVDFAHWLGWRALVVGDPGVGYVRPGGDRLGPLSRLLALVDVARLDPSLVVVQAGHDDHGVPAAAEEAHVAALYAKLSTELPGALLATVTVFARADAPTHEEELTDQAIVAGIERADPGVVVMDPLQEHWRFDRSQLDGLHPSTTGAAQVAYFVERDLEGQGLWRDKTDASQPICDLVVRAPRPTGKPASQAVGDLRRL